MERYLLLLHENPEALPAMSPEELQAVIARYKAWGQRLHSEGRLVGNNKLEDGTGRVLRPNGTGQPKITDGPFTETKDVIGGYFLIEAATYEDAVEQCRDCPHLGFGPIEVRRIDVV